MGHDTAAGTARRPPEPADQPSMLHSPARGTVAHLAACLRRRSASPPLERAPKPVRHFPGRGDGRRVLPRPQPPRDLHSTCRRAFPPHRGVGPPERAPPRPRARSMMPHEKPSNTADTYFVRRASDRPARFDGERLQSNQQMWRQPARFRNTESPLHQSAGAILLSPCKCYLGQPLQRDGPAGSCTDILVHPIGMSEQLLCRVEASREQFCLSEDQRRERASSNRFGIVCNLE